MTGWWKWIAIAVGVIIIGLVLWRVFGPATGIVGVGVFGPATGIVGVVTAASGWLFGRKQKATPDLQMAWDRAKRAREQAEAGADAAGDRAAARVAAADRKADQEVRRALSDHDLGSYLLERDDGTEPGDDD
jgi:hypothetical protein